MTTATPTILVKTYTHNWNAHDNRYDRDPMTGWRPEGFNDWMGATTSHFRSVGGAKRAIVSARKFMNEDAKEYIIVEEKFLGRNPSDPVQVFVIVKW